MGSPLPWLTQDEIADLCKPLTQPAAQARYLRDTFKIEAKRKPDGSLLVMRAQVEAPATATPETPQTGRIAPNRAALIQHWQNKAE
jgi:hypothetical protein